MSCSNKFTQLWTILISIILYNIGDNVGYELWLLLHTYKFDGYRTLPYVVMVVPKSKKRFDKITNKKKKKFQTNKKNSLLFFYLFNHYSNIELSLGRMVAERSLEGILRFFSPEKVTNPVCFFDESVFWMRKLICILF